MGWVMFFLQNVFTLYHGPWSVKSGDHWPLLWTESQDRCVVYSRKCMKLSRQRLQRATNPGCWSLPQCLLAWAPLKLPIRSLRCPSKCVSKFLNQGGTKEKKRRQQKARERRHSKQIINGLQLLYNFCQGVPASSCRLKTVAVNWVCQWEDSTHHLNGG